MSRALAASSAKVQDALSSIDRAKLRATRVPLVVKQVAGLGDSVKSKAEFDQLVTAVYGFWREECSPDIQYILDASATSRIGRHVAFRFTRTIRLLRTAAQHSAAPEAVAFRSKWCLDACGIATPVSEESWEACATQLHAELLAAVETVRDCAEWLTADHARTEAWRSEVAVVAAMDPAAVRDQVLADLELSVPLGSVPHLDRAIEYQLRRRSLSSADDAAALVEAVVEREVVALTLGRLPCRYADILDHLDSWGTDTAVSSLLVAHSVAALHEWRKEEDFLDAVAKVWAAVVAE